MSAGKGHATRPFSWAKWDASKLWKKPNMNTPRTDEILALLPGGQTCDPQAVADALRPEISKMEREFDDWRALMALVESEVANLRAELANERELADKLAAELADIEAASNNDEVHSCDFRKSCRYDIPKALAAWKEARHE